MLRHSSPPVQFLIFALLAFALIWSCRAGDLVTAWQRQGTATAAKRNARVTPAATPTQIAVVETPTEENTPTETVTEEPTETPEPSDTPAPTRVATRPPAPLPTRAAVQPTLKPSPSPTFTPAPPPSPTRCPKQYCVTLADCKPGQDTRAIGTVYENGVPQNGIRVRVSFDYGGAPVTADFISGHDPINRDILDPNHPGYYQIGILEGGARDGNWWVFLVNAQGNQVISEGRWFKTSDLVTGNSCQIGITDFSK